MQSVHLSNKSEKDPDNQIQRKKEIGHIAKQAVYITIAFSKLLNLPRRLLVHKLISLEGHLHECRGSHSSS